MLSGVDRTLFSSEGKRQERHLSLEFFFSVCTTVISSVFSVVYTLLTVEHQSAAVQWG